MNSELEELLKHKPSTDEIMSSIKVRTGFWQDLFSGQIEKDNKTAERDRNLIPDSLQMKTMYKETNK